MLRKFFNNMEEYFLVWSLGFSVVLVFVQVVMRYVFHNSLSWSEELARYLFLWFSWVGASYAVREKSHFRVLMFADILKGRVRTIFELLILLIWCGFSAFLTYQGAVITKFQIVRWQLSPAMEIPMALAYASVPVGCALMTVRLLADIKNTALRLLRPGEAAQI